MDECGWKNFFLFSFILLQIKIRLKPFVKKAWKFSKRKKKHPIVSLLGGSSTWLQSWTCFTQGSGQMTDYNSIKGIWGWFPYWSIIWDDLSGLVADINNLRDSWDPRYPISTIDRSSELAFSTAKHHSPSNYSSLFNLIIAPGVFDFNFLFWCFGDF